ncbi:hypothetical protein C8A00DRAFT_35027 [Chaetomidium leptoderma]|uniref:F-box domain-containing protein n=1 Tax=Chaetomidium leptoderma TaxID=669021 RepID=A0AAN6VJJ1_9PEZI|nr:hypothetical protein C8A00DRAFT_35027 [Chaetomidium leptoderma]
MAQPGLIALPLELLAGICSHLCWHCRGGHANVTGHFEHGAADTRGEPEPLVWSREEQAALLNLGRTCRVLRAAAEPFLYHYLYTASPSDLYFLVRTLLERPDLGPRVSEVDLVHAGGVPGSALTAMDGLDSPSSEPLAQRITESVKSHTARMNTSGAATHLDPRPRYPSIFPGDSEDPITEAEYSELVSLLLPLTPNLQRAHLRLPVWAYPSLETPPHPHCPLLTSLKVLAFSRLGPSFYVNRAAPILRLAPNLEVLQCYDCARTTAEFRAALNCNEAPPPDSNPAQLMPLDNVVELHLTLLYKSSRPTEDYLYHLSKSIGPRLSKVTIRRTVVSRRHQELEFHDTIRSLRHRSQTLRELSFYFTNLGQGLQDSLGPSTYFLGCEELRRALTALEVLRTQTVFVDHTGRQRPSGKDAGLSSMLPLSLRELRLRGFQNRITCLLEGLLEAVVAGEFRALSWVGIDEQGFQDEPVGADGEPGWAGATKLREVAAAFRAAGVEFVVLPPGPQVAGKSPG